MTLRAEVQDWRHRRHDRPLPSVRVEHGPTVAGAWLRVAAGVVATALVLLAASRTPLLPDLTLVGAGVLGAWSVARPGRVPAHVTVVTSALVLLGARSAPFDPAVLGLLPVALLTVRLGWWAEHVGWSARVEIAALRRTAGRDLTIVAVSLVAAAGAWAASGRAVGGLVVLGAVAVVVLAWWALPRWAS
ncbi:hypothetical protein [Isoptericola haloaureus]|uniref:Uncharacterized protein n=1 Tax=Isoptericola haloaureus TaxID=1542902 RepID=A0ABU7Z2M8_9MICO